MFLGVVLSSETNPSTPIACFILSSYSSNFFFLTISATHKIPNNLVIYALISIYFEVLKLVERKGRREAY
jgi:hypothetical protein